MDTRRVVITGVGIINAAGFGALEYINSLKGGKPALTLLDVEASKSNSKIGGAIKRTGLIFEDIERHIYFARWATQEALNQSALRLNHTDIGISFGTAVSATIEMEQFFLNKQGKNISFRFEEVTNYLSNLYGLMGPHFTITTGCTAGLDAIGIGFDQIRYGKVDCMIAGASEAPISPIVIAAFDRIGALSENNNPKYACRPFDTARDGFVIGEGAGVLILEELEHALKRGVSPIAEIKCWHSINNAFHMTSMRTNGEDLIKLINELLDTSKLNINQIDLVDSHGTSTPINDLTEAVALTKVFGKKEETTYLTAQKSYIGHLLGASNAVEIAGVALMIKHKFLPLICNLSNPISELTISPVRRLIENCCIRNAIKLSSSFSGIHSAIVLSKYE